MIVSFRDEDVKTLFQTGRSRRFGNLARVAVRKLQALDYAKTIADSREPPSNHLEQLKGDRAGWWSIRINDQYRICFLWEENEAHEVEIVDYH